MLLALCALSRVRPGSFESTPSYRAATLAFVAALALQRPERLGWLGLTGFDDLIVGPHVVYTLLAFVICWFSCFALQGGLQGRQALLAYFFL